MQCLTCKHALVTPMFRGGHDVSCRCPTLPVGVTDATSCPSYEKGAPVKRFPKPKRPENPR